MSAWPQAVWIINKLEQKENLQGLIQDYENTFESLQFLLQDDQTQLNQLKEKINKISASGGIVVESVNWDSTNGAEGMVWFVYQEQEQEQDILTSEEQTNEQPQNLNDNPGGD